MVETIAPVVHGGRSQSYYRAVAAHVAGAAASAAALGFVLGLVGLAIGAPYGAAAELGAGAGLAIATLALAYAARELLDLPIPLPDLDRQVPDWWRTFYSPGTAALLYGMGLGVGFLTYLSFGTLVPVAGAAIAYGDPVLGAAIVAPFGAARGLSVLIAGGAGRSPEEVSGWLRRRGSRRIASLVNGLLLVAIAGAALISDGAKTF